MKMKIIIGIVLLIIISLSGYRIWTMMNEEEGAAVLISTPVEIVEVQQEAYTNTLKYEGRVAPESLKKISFKSGGRIGNFTGEVGEILKEGSTLVSLDTSDLQASLDGAMLQLSAAQAEYERAVKGARREDIELARINRDKAKSAVDYLKTRVDDVTSLFNEGAVSASELDGLTLEYDLAVNDLALAQQTYEKAINGTEDELIAAAEAQLNLAQVNVDVSKRLLEDGAYVLKEDMVLVQKLYEEGELVPTGYPVAVLRSLVQKVTLGVTAGDLDHVYIGQEAQVRLDGQIGGGQVTRIAEVPDEKHFLYEVEVTLDRQDYRIGDIVKVDLILDEVEIIRVPIAAIMNDGIDYVYLDQDGKAVLQKINIVFVNEGQASVTGLEVGDRLIVSNLNRINENSLIHTEK